MDSRFTGAVEWVWDRMGVPRGNVVLVESSDENRRCGLRTQMLWDGAVTTRVYHSGGQDLRALELLMANHWREVRSKVGDLLTWIQRAVNWPRRGGYVFVALWAAMEITIQLRGVDLSGDLQSILDQFVADALSWLFAAVRTTLVGYGSRWVLNKLSASLIERLFREQEDG